MRDPRVVEVSPPPVAVTSSSVGVAPQPQLARRRPWRRILSLALVAAVAGGIAGGLAGWLAGSRSGPSENGAQAAGGAPSGSTSGSSDPLQSLPSLVATIQASVVDVQGVVEVRDPFGRATTAEVAGSGFVYEADGLIATNAHVVEDATSIAVTFNDDRTYEAEVAGIDTANDLALLRIDAQDLAVLPLATDLTVAVGDFVIVVGNALNLEGSPSVSIGVVSALDRDIEVSSGTSLTGLIQTDAAISSGDSGGPLLSASGAVIGINTAAASSSDTTTVQNIGFAIPISTAAPILAQLADPSSG